MNDQTPLNPVEHAALLDVWNALNCTNALVCPRFAADEPCPTVPNSTIYDRSRLHCAGGSVRALTLDKQYMVNFGTIATAIGSLSMITDIVITDQSRGLTGTIPTEIGLLMHLKSLSLCCNRLSGTIPLQIARITGLEAFGVQHNELIGTIPLEIASLQSLSYVKFYGNQLSGDAPVFRGVNVTRSPMSCQITSTNTESNCFGVCHEPLCCNSGPCAKNNNTLPRSPSTSTSTSTSTSFTSFTFSFSSFPSSTSFTINTSLSMPFTRSPRPSGDSGNVTVLILVLIGTLLALIAVIASIFCVVRRRRRRKTGGDGSTAVVTAPVKADTPLPGQITYDKVPQRTSNYDVGNLNF